MDLVQDQPRVGKKDESSCNSLAGAGWTCQEIGEFRNIVSPSGWRPFSWLDLKPLWRSRNQILGHLFGDPTNDERRQWVRYVLDVLTSALAAKGHSSTWAKVMSTATSASGPGALKGTEVLEALQSEAGWEGVFWSPDPRNPKDRSPEHPAAFKQVRETGTYSPTGVNIPVDRSKSVINYRRTDPAVKQNLSGIERLKRLQFGVLATRGGMHMALIINGSVYEVHWDKPASDPNAIQATPLETFAWQSGVIVAPKGDLERAWNTP